MKAALVMLVLFVSLACTKSNWKTLDVEQFTIETPRNWKYIKGKGVDSFAGDIKGPRILLEFDYSDFGYAGLSVDEPIYFVNNKIKYEYSKLFNKPGVRYYKDSADFEFRKQGYLSSTGKHMPGIFEPIIRPKSKIYKPLKKDLEKYPEADYMVDLIHKDSTITVAVKLLKETHLHNFKVDTIGQYIITYVWPKETSHGITGIWYREIDSKFTFKMNGKNLPAKQQYLALKAFASIHLKEN